MKIKALSVACSMALAASAVSTTVAAEEGFEFHGYFRSGALFTGSTGGNQALYPASKESLGRLGIESDDFYELAFNKTWALDNGQKIAIKTRLGQHNTGEDAFEAQQNYSINGSATGLLEGFVEFEGLTNTGKMWSGQRYYGRDNYIFMTDFFYTDWSGTGLGVQQMELGGGKWDFAYLASNRPDDNGYGSDESAPLHLGHARADYGNWRVELVGKYMADNVSRSDDGNGNITVSEFATNGIEAHVQYTPKDFFWLGNGFSKISVQAGSGLGASSMLGKSFTNYNGYAPGSAGKGPVGMAHVDKGDKSYRALAYGGWFGSSVMIFPSVQMQYDDLDNGNKSLWWSAMARPVFLINSIDNFTIATEFGYTETDVEGSGGNTLFESSQYKATIAPTWVIGTGTGPAPEIRLLASYIDGKTNGQDNTNANGEQKGEFVYGVQADMWW
ncbi:maltoporin [Agarivorans sp. B2Z047]|uniref:carbohydrate porin n=1 Tax=Agarivorans sp. B2Z047 TaxID=2652721 RepID=UPI00128B9694|nr:carbohydrate porin [Agarivorans sp. B2Z047]MPW31731.1 maltoporin [Agarivorans sp. B2Z047]UQN44794.1 carbohydrate porin [Agarivorans sp. B2Z047]